MSFIRHRRATSPNSVESRNVYSTNRIDRSYEICLALKKKYTEIKLYRTNGKGVSAARNTGLSHSTGDVVGFCDSDDIYEKDVFEKVRLFFENKDIDIVIGGFYYSKKDSLNTVVQETHSHNRQLFCDIK